MARPEPERRGWRAAPPPPDSIKRWSLAPSLSVEESLDDSHDADDQQDRGIKENPPGGKSGDKPDDGDQNHQDATEDTAVGALEPSLFQEFLRRSPEKRSDVPTAPN